jgi:putative addiction module antidote
MTVINTRKLRKIGNSKVLTIPEEVIQTLNVNEGQKIAFNIDNGQVLLEAVKTDNKEMDILSMADQVSNQYGNALKGLVNR